MTETLEDKKQRCKDLIRKKDEMEKEMDTLFEYFDREDVKGFKIIDEDGYPNEDSGKIYEVKLKKHKLATLKTDHKNLISEIETLLCEIYSIQKEATKKEQVEKQEEAPKAESKSVSFDLSKLELKLVVNSVAEGSPAGAGGLKAGDIVVKYGSVDVATYMAEDRTYLLEDVNTVTKSSVGRSIRVEVVRGPECPILSVTPNKWNGPGILGCHFAIN